MEFITRIIKKLKNYDVSWFSQVFFVANPKKIKAFIFPTLTFNTSFAIFASAVSEGDYKQCFFSHFNLKLPVKKVNFLFIFFFKKKKEN